MSEETVVAAPSAEPVEMDIAQGPLVNMTPDERTEFGKTGELPKPKTEEAAASSEAKPEGEAKPAGESETPQAQEKTGKQKPTASERVAQLRATIAKIEKEAGLKTEAVESSPTKPVIEPIKRAPQEIPPTRPKPTGEEVNPDGTPKYATWDDLNEDLIDWKVEQREAKAQHDAAKKAQLDEGLAKVAEAKTRYENFDEVMKPFWDEVIVNPKISPVVKEVIDESDYFADLAYTIGSSKEELAKFVAMPPGKQLRYIALTESLIADELESKQITTTEDTPAKPVTRAPRPPSEAGGRAASPPDALEAAAKSNDFRAFEAESTRRQLAKLKGS